MKKEEQYKVKQACQKCFSYETEEAGIDYSDGYGDRLLKCNNCGYAGKVYNLVVFTREFNKKCIESGLEPATIKEFNPEEENEYTVIFRPFQNREEPQQREEDKNRPDFDKYFSKCEKCGEYNGRVKNKDLNWEGFFHKDEEEKYTTLSCLCKGILCPRCKKNKIHRPISNSYDPKNNTIGHWPWFTGWMPCEECRKKDEEGENKT
jgi:hypothetical protein